MYLQKWGNRKFALFPKGLYLELLAFSTEDFETTGFVRSRQEFCYDRDVGCFWNSGDVLGVRCSGRAHM